MARIYIYTPFDQFQKGQAMLSVFSQRRHEAWITLDAKIILKWLTSSDGHGGFKYAQPELLIVVNPFDHNWFRRVLGSRNHPLPLLVISDDPEARSLTAWVLPLQTDPENVVAVTETILAPPT